MITLLYLVLAAVFTGVIYLTYVAIAAQKETEYLFNDYLALKKQLETLRVSIDVVLSEDAESKEKRNKILLRYYHFSSYEK